MLADGRGPPRGLRQSRSHLPCRRPTFDPWVGKFPWRRERLPTPVILSGEFHGQRNLVAPATGHSELDTTVTDKQTIHAVHTGADTTA